MIERILLASTWNIDGQYTIFQFLFVNFYSMILRQLSEKHTKHVARDLV